MKQSAARQSGSAMIFFLAGMMPLLLLVWGVTNDITMYHRARQRMQQTVDDAVLYGYQYLPYTESARSAVVSYLKGHRVPEEPAITVDQSMVGVSVAGKMKLPLLSFFMPGRELGFEARAKARGTPFDVYIAMDRSGYLAPADPESLWGDKDAWPASSWKIPLEPLDSRYLTQKCFNESFNRVKNTAIHAWDYLAGFPMNAVGVGVFPGTIDGNYSTRIRKAALGPEEGLQVTFPTANTLHGSNDFCAAAASYENTTQAYRVPGQSLSIKGLWIPPAIGEPLTEGNSYNPAHASELTVREVLWSQVADDTQWPVTKEVFADLFTNVILPGQATRRGLANMSRQTILFVAGDVPYHHAKDHPEIPVPLTTSTDEVAYQFRSAFEPIAPLLAEESRFSLSIYYLLLPSPRSVFSADKDGLTQEMNELFRALEQAFGTRLRMRFIAGETGVDEALAHILMDRKSAVLSCTGGMHDC